MNTENDDCGVYIMTLDEFIESIRMYVFIDDDGSGYYAHGDIVDREKPCVPSDIMKGIIDRSYTHVAWYNK